MGDSGSDDEDTSWESKWTEKQEKYKAYAVSKLQKHLAEIQEDIDKYDVKLEKLRKKEKKGELRATAPEVKDSHKLDGAPRSEKKGEKRRAPLKEVKDSRRSTRRRPTRSGSTCASRRSAAPRRSSSSSSSRRRRTPATTTRRRRRRRRRSSPRSWRGAASAEPRAESVR